jgi:hypothetical protein
LKRHLKTITAIISAITAVIGTGWFGQLSPPPTKDQISNQLEQLIGKPHGQIPRKHQQMDSKNYRRNGSVR